MTIDEALQECAEMALGSPYWAHRDGENSDPLEGMPLYTQAFHLNDHGCEFADPCLACSLTALFVACYPSAYPHILSIVWVSLIQLAG